MNNKPTSLIGKEYSPLVIRKYTNLEGLGGIPVFVALITDDNVADLDADVHSFVAKFVGERGKPTDIQAFRNFAGALAEHLASIYGRAEGVAVVLFPDKAAVSSLVGDFMNHLHCRIELYLLINTMWHL